MIPPEQAPQAATNLEPCPARNDAAGFFRAWFCWPRRALLLQLLGTLIVLGWVPGNGIKLGAMFVLWAIGFGRLSRRELAAVGLVNLVFIAMDEAALRQGIFSFNHPDALGLPYYEFFMWGFYILHSARVLDVPRRNMSSMLGAICFVVAFSLCFSLITAPMLLAAAAGVVTLAGLAYFHEPVDFFGAIHMTVLGALVEYVGVGTGQWSYPHAPGDGVPLWSFLMWAGFGLFSRRLLAPLLHRERLESRRNH